MQRGVGIATGYNHSAMTAYAPSDMRHALNHPYAANTSTMVAG
jgi:hypothetical protein